MHLLAGGAFDMPTKTGDRLWHDRLRHALRATSSSHRFFTCTVCTTLSPLPRMGACVNMTTGRLAAAAFSSCSGMQVRTHSVSAGQRWGFWEV